MILNLIVIICGFIISIFLFNKFPVISKEKTSKTNLKISVVIPARNEEHTLPLLLEDLKNQDANIFEIICVDDDSNDGTERVIKKYGAKLISITDKPDDWTGKSWACHIGASESCGDMILFLDADVRLRENAVSKLINTYEKNKCVISVQPYHQTKKIFEQLSIFFNIVQIGANAVSFPFGNKNVGLFGPLIFISKENYNYIGTHFSVKESIIEDVSLGEKLKKSGIKYRLFMGGHDISFRMYSDGIKSLFQGWSKNFASGAVKTDLIILVLVFWWLTACASAPINLIYSIIDMDRFSFFVYLTCYLIWVIELFRVSIKTGKFMKWGILLYPIPLLAFFVIFIFSSIKKIFRLKTTWKERKIKLER